ncbi:MBL fold metallo-hydrolase [Mesorhizobium sp. ASY16-5R]|uniref:MBL fold metallo-hydrolase n=1 Tax=Mesorhizobium sp. ASY16-5R TaxID=3445772 RepID=UPI003F9F50F2
MTGDGTLRGAGRPRTRNAYYEGPPSRHFDGRIFFNPGGLPPGTFRQLLKWQMDGSRTKWPAEWPSPYPQALPEPRIEGSTLRLAMVGHSTLLVQAGGLNILTDPVWSERVSPLSFAGPKRVNPPGIAFSDLPRIDLVLVSHNHYDHLDLTTLKRLKAGHDPLFVTPLGNDTIIRAAVPDARISVHDWDEEVRIDACTTVHIEPVHHWSARGMRDRRMALWCGFVIEGPAGKIFFAGDTGFHGGAPYRRLAQRHGALRLAVLPIGAYEPRWFMEPQHQNPEEAVLGMQLCGASFAVGCHWGTFHLTNEPVDEPRQKLLAALAAHGVARERFRPMRPGEIWDVPEAPGSP